MIPLSLWNRWFNILCYIILIRFQATDIFKDGNRVVDLLSKAAISSSEATWFFLSS